MEDALIPTLAEVSYSRGLKKITCLRFLASKIVFEPNQVRFTDWIVIYDLLLWSQDKAAMDRGFKSKFGKTLEVLAQIMKNRRFHSSVEIESLTKKVRGPIKTELESFLIPARNYSTVKNRMSGKFHLRRPKQPGVDIKNLPPQRYIGIGYRDKGTAKDPAVDGSQTWQQIASDDSYQIKILLEILKNDRTISFKEKRTLQKEVIERLKRLQENRSYPLSRSEEKVAKT